MNSLALLPLVGDLAHSRDILMNDTTPATGDTAVLLEIFAKVRALMETMPDLTVVTAHDLQASDKLAGSVEGMAPVQH